MRSFKFGKETITDDSFPYIIAEIGVNHAGCIKKAKELIDLAKAGGAHAVKFQSYKAGTLASKFSPSYWDLNKEPTASQYELFKKYDSFGKDDYIELFEYCKKQNVAFLSTPFDDDSIEFLNPLVDFYKIASADLTNTPFLRKIAKTGKPVVLSTGASTLAEIDSAVNELTKNGAGDIALLHCVLNYPTCDENANLSMIESLRRSYPQLIIGYSDHTLPDENMTVLTVAYLKGARIIEKHFTYDKSLTGNDHYHAMNSEDIQIFAKQINRVRLIEGSFTKQPLVSEEISRKNARRSIVLKRAISAGEVISEDMLTYKRPGTGVSPMHWDQVVGLSANKDLEEDHVLQWMDIK